MNQKFRDLVESLEPKYQALVSMHPVRFGSLPGVMPEPGIYLFSEGAQHLYVGVRTAFANVYKTIAGWSAWDVSSAGTEFSFRIFVSQDMATGRKRSAHIFTFHKTGIPSYSLDPSAQASTPMCLLPSPLTGSDVGDDTA